MKRVDVYMTPGIMKSATNGKTYIVAGKWIEVPDGTTLADAHLYVNHIRPRGAHQASGMLLLFAKSTVFQLESFDFCLVRLSHRRRLCPRGACDLVGSSRRWIW